MKTFIGTKLIQAEPEDSAMEGIPGYRVTYADGYTSWSPKASFDGAYRTIDAMTFGDAIHMLKAGKRVARAGWNGKGMWLEILVDGSQTYELGDGKEYSVLPWIGMKTADDRFVPWLASQTDVLAEDWRIVE